MRRLLWLVLVGAVLLSTVAYAATYNATITTYSVGGSHNLQQINSTLVEPPNYSVSYGSSYMSKDSILRGISYFVSGTSSYVLREPSDVWHNCGYSYRLPVLFEVDESLTNVYIDFNISNRNFLGNLSSGSGVKVYFEDGTELKFSIEENTSTHVIFRVYFDSLGAGFHYVYFYFGGSKEPLLLPITVENRASQDFTDAVVTVNVHSDDPYFIDSSGNLLYYMYTGGGTAYVKIPYISASQTVTIYECVLGDDPHLAYNVSLTPTIFTYTYDFQDSTTQGWTASGTSGFTFNLVNDNGDYALHINEGSGGSGAKPNWYRDIDFLASGKHTITVRVYATSGYSTTTNLFLHIDDASYAAFFSGIQTASGTYSLEFYVDAGKHKIGLAYHDGWSSDWNYDVKIYEVSIDDRPFNVVTVDSYTSAATTATTGVGSVQSAPDSCYVTETTTTTTTSDFFSWYESGGGGAPLPSSGGDGLGSELSTHTDTEAPMSFPEVVTKVKEVSNWLVSRSGRSALLFFGLLIILGLVLLSGSRSKGKRGVRGGGRRRR